MITRFFSSIFSATRSAVLAIPGNPYATIAALKADAKVRSARHDIAVNRWFKHYCDAASMYDDAARQLSKAKQRLAAHSQANEAFMDERADLKEEIRVHTIAGLFLTRTAMDQQAVIEAMGAELAETVEANESLATALAEQQAYIPFLQAVEAKLKLAGIVMDTEGEEPVVTVDTTILAGSIREGSVKLALVTA